MTLTDLYEEYESYLRSYAVHLGHDTLRADDLVQETFIRAMGHLALLQVLKPHQRRAWLSRTLKNLADRLDKVHNFGEIICTPEQAAAFQARLGLNEGEFVDSGEGEGLKRG